MTHDPRLVRVDKLPIPIRDGQITVTKQQNLDSSIESATYAGKVINAFYNELKDLPEDMRKEITNQFAAEMMVAVKVGVSQATGG